MGTSFDAAAPPTVRIHYLGHASFVLQFDDRLTVLTDYGSLNAWVEWGWDSPIYDIGDLVPDVMTYSHTHHADHYDEERKPAGVRHVLAGAESLSIDGLTISPIPTSEQSLEERENTSYCFAYRGLRIVHLGDCQANIMHVADDENRQYLQKVLPAACDLVLMPIEGQSKFIPQAEAFLHLLQPRCVIPMHYWSDAYKEQFLAYLGEQNQESGGHYRIERVQGADSVLPPVDSDPVQVLVLTPAAYQVSGLKSEG